MEWDFKKISELVNTYNTMYFDNAIKYPIEVIFSRHLSNSDSSTSGYHVFKNNIHYIVLNAKYMNASVELLKSVLVHEMIHAWQYEYAPISDEERSTSEGHGDAFIQKSNEISSKDKFTYPLQRYLSQSAVSQLKKQSRSLYYVYVEQTYEDNGETITYPEGVFVRSLYDDEVKHLRKNGLKVKYYRAPKFSSTCAYVDFRNKYIVDAPVLVTYNTLKHVTSANFYTALSTAGKKLNIMTDDMFNYNDGIEVI